MSIETTNINNAQSNKWTAVLQGHEDLTFKIVGGMMPSVASGTTDIGGSENISLQVPGDHVTMDDLSFDFLIDENFKNYITLFEWLEENTRANEPVLKDLTIHLLDARGKFRGLRVLFTNTWPSTLAGWLFDADNSDSDIRSTVTMKYERMQFIQSPEEPA